MHIAQPAEPAQLSRAPMDTPAARRRYQGRAEDHRCTARCAHERERPAAFADARRVPPAHRDLRRRRRRRAADRRLPLHDRCGVHGLGRLLRSRQRRRPRVFLVAASEAHRRLSPARTRSCRCSAYERSVLYPEGHRNVVFPQRGIRPLPRLPKMAADSPPHPRPTRRCCTTTCGSSGASWRRTRRARDMGTDWRDNDPLLEPVVEIYQGDRQNYEMPGRAALQ